MLKKNLDSFSFTKVYIFVKIFDNKTLPILFELRRQINEFMVDLGKLNYGLNFIKICNKF